MKDIHKGNKAGWSHRGPADSAIIDSLLTELARADATREAPSILRQRLQAEARRHAEHRSAQPELTLVRRWALPLAGSAAVLAVLVAAVSSSPKPGKIITAARSAVLAVSRGAGSTPKPDPKHAAGVAEVASIDDSLSAFPDTFYVPYSDPSISNGTGATVRVSLPESELLAWGVPATGREPDDLVPVDLTLGDDGLPRAVRLLPATSTSEEIYP